MFYSSDIYTNNLESIVVIHPTAFHFFQQVTDNFTKCVIIKAGQKNIKQRQEQLKVYFLYFGICLFLMTCIIRFVVGVIINKRKQMLCILLLYARQNYVKYSHLFTKIFLRRCFIYFVVVIDYQSLFPDILLKFFISSNKYQCYIAQCFIIDGRILKYVTIIGRIKNFLHC